MKRFLFTKGLVIILNLFLAFGWLLIAAVTRDYMSPLPEPIKAEVFIPPNSEFKPVQFLPEKRIEVPNLACLETMRGDKECVIFHDKRALYYLVEFPGAVFSYTVRPNVVFEKGRGLIPGRIVMKNSEVFVEPKKDLFFFSSAFYAPLFIIFFVNLFIKTIWEDVYREKLEEEKRVRERTREEKTPPVCV